MSARRKPPHARSSNPIRTVVYGCVILILLLLAVFARASAQGLLWRIFAPVSSFGGRLSGGIQFLELPFISKESLIAENTALRAQLVQVQSEAADRAQLLAENTDLKSALMGTSVNRTLAHVVARPPQLPYDTLLLSIDSSAKAEVAPGDVVGQGGVAFGAITDASAYTARAVLFSSAGVMTNAFINNATPVTLIGQGGGAFTARVPQGTIVAPGDSAVLADASHATVAEVSYVQNPEGNQIFKEVYFTTPVSLFSLSDLEVWHEILPQATSTSSPTFPTTPLPAKNAPQTSTQ